MKEEGIRISSDITFVKKYILSLLLYGFGFFALYKGTSKFFLFFLGIVSILYATLYIKLSSLYFNESFIFLGKKRYTYDDIVHVKFYEFNLYMYIQIKVKEGNKSKSYFIDPGGKISILDILYAILTGKKNVQSMKLFLDTLKEKGVKVK
ncbi:hypothetical protein K6119_09780 [Paracrocinitomix mangrovi]|uniref:hypothetical protein n=1 Tax=Paracrocinitomix mangrovi TaxID=2862509 RepID=UPI001C8E8E36|nr:hypothetical protein [Paracrocinitomix mangrovi]UKN03779.1 hypothetical protein K6119_09780 [Paracrocinitomix mangrovi]